MSPSDIIARLERSPAAWVCIRREAADEIRKLRAENAALEAKLAIAVEALVCIVDFHIYGPSKMAREAITKIKETK